jgi:tripartite ATP-independent transporter DctP family solute receptor
MVVPSASSVYSEEKMTTLSRRSFTALAGLATIGVAVPLRYAKAAEFSFKLGTNVPETHPLNIYAQKAAEELTQTTDGRFELKIFANNQLGGDSDMFSQLRSGALECFTLSGVNVLSTLIPSAAIWGVGFAWKDYPTLWNALDGKFGAHLRSHIDKAGLVVMDKIWDNGFRQVTTSVRPIVTPADFQGLKIRVPVSALWTSLFKSLGASPTGINFAEVYSALQTKVVDGQENPPAIISAAKLYEVQKYCSLTNHMWDGWWFLVNRRAWQSVPADLQDKVAAVINKNAVAEREEIARQNTSLKSDLAAKGLIFNDVDPAPFRETLSKSGFYTEWKSKFGEEAWALLEEATGKLG